MISSKWKKVESEKGETETETQLIDRWSCVRGGLDASYAFA